MKTEPANNLCPQCAAPLPEDAPQGLCPKCLLAAAATPTEPSLSPAPQPAPPIEAVAAAFPNLEILHLIGHGGMGMVYKARQPRLDRFVALKLLPVSASADAAFVERFNREARVLARLNHPNIVTVFDFGQAGPFLFLLMEYVDGVNLRQAMRAARFTPQQALRLVPRVCEALQFAHDEGILHRDIKPENILLDGKGRVKIADFGIAKLLGEPHPVTKLTATGAAVGTPNYMAPEQLENPEDVDARADIYSLGVVFYEMLTGELPIGRFAPPSKKTDTDERVDEIVLRALARERELRQQSASEVKTQVESLRPTEPQAPAATLDPAPPLAGGSPAVAPGAPPTAGPAWSRWAVWGAALTGLSLPLPCLILVGGLLGSPGIGPAELWFAVGCAVLLVIPGTLLGWMALSQIRHSQGRLHGLPLAVFAALTWPVLAPFLATLLPPALIATPQPLFWGPALLLIPAGVVVFGVWAVRAAARWGRGPSPNRRDGSGPGHREAATAAPAHPAAPWSGKAVFAALLAGIGLFPPLLMIALGFYLALPVDHNFVAANLHSQFLFGIFATLVPALAGTILGGFALFDVRAAAGRIRGGRFAAWATLFWPLLILNALLLVLAAGVIGRPAVRLGGGMGALLLILPCILALLLGLDAFVSARVCRWAFATVPLDPARHRSSVPVTLALCLGLGLIIPAFAMALSVWLPMLARTNPGSSRVGLTTQSASVRQAELRITTPPRQRFTAAWTVLSNGVSVLDPVRVADLPTPAQAPGQFTVQWRVLDPSGPDNTTAPWEVIVLDGSTNRFTSRPPPGVFPDLEWLGAASRKTKRFTSAIKETLDTQIFHATPGSADAAGAPAVRWSVRLVLTCSAQSRTSQTPDRP